MREDETTRSNEAPRRSDLRREREAEALRANLRKRKEQQRARDARATPADEEFPADDAT